MYNVLYHQWYVYHSLSTSGSWRRWRTRHLIHRYDNIIGKNICRKNYLFFRSLNNQFWNKIFFKIIIARLPSFLTDSSAVVLKRIPWQKIPVKYHWNSSWPILYDISKTPDTAIAYMADADVPLTESWGTGRNSLRTGSVRRYLNRYDVYAFQLAPEKLHVKCKLPSPVHHDWHV